MHFPREWDNLFLKKWHHHFHGDLIKVGWFNLQVREFETLAVVGRKCHKFLIVNMDFNMSQMGLCLPFTHNKQMSMILTFMLILSCLLRRSWWSSVTVLLQPNLLLYSDTNYYEKFALFVGSKWNWSKYGWISWPNTYRSPTHC